jgi:hypothetical protein
MELYINKKGELCFIHEFLGEVIVTGMFGNEYTFKFETKIYFR